MGFWYNGWNKSCLYIWGDLRTVFEPHPKHKNSPAGPKKAKNDAKTKSKLEVRIEENEVNMNC